MIGNDDDSFMCWLAEQLVKIIHNDNVDDGGESEIEDGN